MRFIKIAGIYRNLSLSRPSLSQSNAAELWKLATKTKQSNTLKDCTFATARSPQKRRPWDPDEDRLLMINTFGP